MVQMEMVPELQSNKDTGEPTDRQEWLKWRKNGIGGSDAAAIHGKSPYKTAIELWDDKISEDIEEDDENGFAKDLGNQFEPIARKLFAAEYNIENGTDEVFLAARTVSADLPIILNSLDGRSYDGQVIGEFKYQGKDPHEKIKDESLPIRGGRVREDYWIQCQHNLLGSGAKVCYFVSYNPKAEVKMRKIAIYPDEQFQIEHIKKCTEFWDMVQTRTQPPASDKDFVALREKGAKALSVRWLFLKRKLDEYQEEMEEIRAKLVEMAEKKKHPRMVCNGIKIVQIVKKGNIDYKKVPELKGLKPEYLDQFRGKTSSYYKMEAMEDGE